LEPFPFEPDDTRPVEGIVGRASACRLQAAKFVQGQFAESDYESELEGSRIPSRWQPPGSDTEETSGCYKKIQLPIKLPADDVNPVESKPQQPDKSPSPPSKFDANPLQFDGPPRPEFKKPSPPIQSEPKIQPQSEVFKRKLSITDTETVQRMQMEESTGFSKRFVTRKISFVVSSGIWRMSKFLRNFWGVFS
jgi:hypothetical protein